MWGMWGLTLEARARPVILLCEHPQASRVGAAPRVDHLSRVSPDGNTRSGILQRTNDGRGLHRKRTILDRPRGPVPRHAALPAGRVRADGASAHTNHDVDNDHGTDHDLVDHHHDDDPDDDLGVHVNDPLGVGHE